MAISAGARLGPYEVLSAIGAGGMGEVYRAHDSKLGRDVALKVLPSAFAADVERMARFDREARLLAALNHPNIAHIYGLEESSGTPALVMELVEGPTLADRIAAGPVRLDEALPIAKQIAEALEYAHERGVIHRDVKPANIKVKADGTVKVLDFGLAKALTEDQSAADMNNSPTLSMGATVAGVILGTAAYMSPEQAKAKPADRRADIWAFGVMLYEMLTGAQLYMGETAAETLASVIKETPDLGKLPPDTPAAIRYLIARCLEKDPHQRLQHIGEARIAIARAKEPAPEPYVAPRTQRQKTIAWMGFGALLLAGFGAFAFAYFLTSAPSQPDNIRFEITAPVGSTFTFFELSPDGKLLAFTAQKEGHVQLWVRPLNSLETRALSGTDGATYPFWSPDSSYLGFFADGKLKKIAVSGGVPQVLCDAPAGRGGTWGEGGVILFSPNEAGPLYRVPAAGGVPSVVTESPEGPLNSDRHARFLPGGNSFLYTRLRGSYENDGIYAGSLDGVKPTRILPDNSNAIYVPTASAHTGGYILFRRKETLMAQPFDPKGLKTTGEMFPVAEKLGVAANASYAGFTASWTGHLAYRSGNPFENRQLIWVNRAGNQLGTATQSARLYGGELSPDGKQIASAIVQDTGDTDIWLQDVTRGVISRFTFGPGARYVPVWSPDSMRIAFTTYTSGIGYTLRAKAANGAGAEESLAGPGVMVLPNDWSPDGKFIVYSQFSEKTNDDLWLLPMQGDRKPIPYLLTPFNESEARFSPDGNWLAYMSDESGRMEVYVQTFPASGRKWQISSAGARFPKWSHDGRELFYISADQKLMSVPVKLGAAGSGSFEAGVPVPLFDVASVPANTRRYSYQPTADGRRFLLSAPATGEDSQAPPITVELNWQAGLKK